ncbi:hypothetical protein [Halobacillus hunanensis]|nr:hypothetical protein [Halobacillus hunanensis]
MSLKGNKEARKPCRVEKTGNWLRVIYFSLLISKNVLFSALQYLGIL